MKLFWLIKAALRLRIIKPKRYRSLIREIQKNKSKTIVEVGVFNGRNSKRMIETAKGYNKASNIDYHGFDLFEMLTESELKEEFSKMPLTESQIREKLGVTGVNLHLYKGYSQETLKNFVQENKGKFFDFIFIDGGHSIDTIISDWNNLVNVMGPDTVVIFDDYYRNTEKEILGKGCNDLIDKLDQEKYKVEFLNPINEFQHDWGILRVQFVKVTLKK